MGTSNGEAGEDAVMTQYIAKIMSGPRKGHEIAVPELRPSINFAEMAPLVMSPTRTSTNIFDYLNDNIPLEPKFISPKITTLNLLYKTVQKNGHTTFSQPWAGEDIVTGLYHEKTQDELIDDAVKKRFDGFTHTIFEKDYDDYGVNLTVSVIAGGCTEYHRIYLSERDYVN